MIQRTQIRRISAKRLAGLGGKMPFSTIRPRLKFPHKGKPRSTRGNSIRKEKLFCLPRNTRRQVKAAAGLQRSSRRVNRLPEWKDPQSYITKGGRHRLFGEDYEALRWLAYERAKGLCQCGCGRGAGYFLMGLPSSGELAHHEHGARKSDELHRVDWMRHECHMNSHNCGGKPIAVTKKSLKEKIY